LPFKAAFTLLACLLVAFSLIAASWAVSSTAASQPQPVCLPCLAGSYLSGWLGCRLGRACPRVLAIAV
jgi:hypothetical protein